MTNQGFNTVRKGYDPTEVHQAVAALQSTITRLENQLAITHDAGAAASAQAVEQQQVVDDLSMLATALRRDLDAANKQLAEGPAVDTANYDHLGARVSQILNLAQEEAGEVRQSAKDYSDHTYAETQARADQMIAEAERESADVRSKADTDAARTVEDANKRADDIRAEVDSEAAASRDEAAALMESQRASATAAAIDFERTLSDRRNEALESLEADVAARHQEINEATTRLNEIRSEAQRTEYEARERAEQVVRSAEQRSNELVTEAEVRAEAIRQNAERELTAALSRRDSINEQLGSVRQMLSAYGAPAAAELVDVEDVAVEYREEDSVGSADGTVEHVEDDHTDQGDPGENENA